MTENVKLVMLPKAEKLDFLIKPLLQRSFDKFVANKRRDVVSEYMGGNIIVVTFQKEGQPHQIALDKTEINQLPEECQKLLRRHLATIPGERGWFSAEVTP